jgi:hypothetical protein
MEREVLTYIQELFGRLKRSGWLTKVKSTETARRSTTTLTADADLKFEMEANVQYQFRAKVYFDSGSTPDFKWRHNGPSSPTLVRINRRSWPCGASAWSEAVDTAYSSSDIVLDGSASTGGVIEFEGTITNGSTDGAFEFQWAQNTSDASDTKVLAGSYIEYRRMD